jgi:COPII coat assembly protein SEC16
MSSFEPTSSYEPSSSYEPPAYQGSSYQPYEPEPEQQVQKPEEHEGKEELEPKKKSYMDDDDDDDEDLMARATALKNEAKVKADRETDEAFRKAAKADGKRLTHLFVNIAKST